MSTTASAPEPAPAPRRTSSISHLDSSIIIAANQGVEDALPQTEFYDAPENTCERYCALFKDFYSSCLLIFSVVIIMGLIFTSQTALSSNVHPALAFVVIWGSVIWLSVVEGGQGPMVGLPPVESDLFKESHPITYKCTSLCHKGDNLDRYLMGRQFMVVMIVFVTNLSGAPISGAELWGMPNAITQIFLVSGVAMILMTAMMGQLSSQVTASHCMLDFSNRYLAYFTLLVTLVIEFSGLLHASYLVQMLVAKLAGKPIESREETKTPLRACFFWFRIILSLAILGFSLAVTLAALFQGKTTMWEGVPEAVSIILFFLLVSIVGLLEGMQIAFFAVTKLPKSEQGKHKFALKTCRLLFRGDGHNLPGFMIGRQVCVTLCFFVIARVTSLNVDTDDPNSENIFGVGDGAQKFFNTGLLGAIITTILGSISWQLVASAFPIAFLSNPIVYIFLRLCLVLEATGICSGSWVIARVMKKIRGFQRDEVYIGSPEERAAKKHADARQDLEPGHWRVPHVPPGADRMPKNEADEDYTETERG